MQKRLKHYVLAAMLLLAPMAASAQVTIGSGEKPAEFSVLELISNDKLGIRLPQIETTDLRNAMLSETEKKDPLAQGLQIFNMETRCVETWNGSTWIQQCPPGGPYVEPITVIPDGTGASNWTATNRWVGAFWRNDQTGERIIRAYNILPWSVSVDANCAGWVTLDEVRSGNETLWTDAPDDAENYQILNGVSALADRSGDILFRIGLKSINPDFEINPPLASSTSEYKAMDREGRTVESCAPRYGTITLTIDGDPNSPYKLHIRQGEAADFVFGKNDPVTGAMTGLERPLATQFSPYNLTDPKLTEDTPALGVQTDVKGGVFVDFPTQAGAFWQWGTDLKDGGNHDLLRHAYHPTKPVGAITGWDTDDSYPLYDYTWKALDGANVYETCPSGWRRPMILDGDLPGRQIYNRSAPADASELMQSLFEVTFSNDGSNTNLDNHRYFGYYADGFFDRRPIETQEGNTPRARSVVSKDNKNAAYTGVLFTNPATDASLFVPASGYRATAGGSLSSAGSSSNVWSSSITRGLVSWHLSAGSAGASQIFKSPVFGYAVRCVTE